MKILCNSLCTISSPFTTENGVISIFQSNQIREPISENLSLKLCFSSQVWWRMPVIPVTQEAEIGRILVLASLGKKF
jgi:hypothetical protein